MFAWDRPTTTDTYNLDGQLVLTTDPMGNVTAYAYDAFGNRVTQSLPDQYGGEQDPWSPTTTFTYDGNGDMLSLTDPDGNTTSWTYDAAGDETSQSKVVTLGYNYDGTINNTTATDTYYYDLDRNLASSTDADGNTNTYAFDWMNRETSDSIAGTNGSDQYSFAYDVAGDMTSASNDAATYAYEYGPSGNLDAENVQMGDLPNVVLTSTYDNNGNRLTLAANIGGTMAGGTVTGGYNDFENAYKYNALGQMALCAQESKAAPQRHLGQRRHAGGQGGDVQLQWRRPCGGDRPLRPELHDGLGRHPQRLDPVGRAGVHVNVHLRRRLEPDRFGL